MSRDPHTITYIFGLEDEDLVFTIDTRYEKIQTRAPFRAPENYPDWTLLHKDQCPCCPLKTSDSRFCPAAVRIHEVLETFKGSKSVQKIDLTVETTRRVYQQDCDLQSALNSMLGLQMATSGCPVLIRLRSMATFHMPFCSFGETLYRTVSSYLTQQFFIYKEGGSPDWDLQGLKCFYETLEGLNQAFSQRIKAIEESDAASNAIIMFFAASIVVADAIDNNLSEYKDYFTGRASQPPQGG
ncbi:DUF6901 family protein [Coraliomargarita parva]|uniref:DUF6901 family protein n=1 Tax=Coraliomargarita parva TaxID=3014050 RepID=UPI0022B49CD2|nr:hypothetical protein [Coraliomargarita parva]